MVCEVCRTGPEGMIEQGALWASEGTKCKSTKVPCGLSILILSLITDTLPPLVSRSKLAEIGYNTEVFDSKTVSL